MRGVIWPLQGCKVLPLFVNIFPPNILCPGGLIWSLLEYKSSCLRSEKAWVHGYSKIQISRTCEREERWSTVITKKGAKTTCLTFCITDNHDVLFDSLLREVPKWLQLQGPGCGRSHSSPQWRGVCQVHCQKMENSQEIIREVRPERGGPCWLLKLMQMGPSGVQMKEVLPWLVRWARRAGRRDFYPSFAFLDSQVLNNFSSLDTISLFVFLLPSNLGRHSCRVALWLWVRHSHTWLRARTVGFFCHSVWSPNEVFNQSKYPL
jgi:hypothetical protein